MSFLYDRVSDLNTCKVCGKKVYRSGQYTTMITSTGQEIIVHKRCKYMNVKSKAEQKRLEDIDTKRVMDWARKQIAGRT